MLNVLYIIINISCPRKRIKNRGMSCNLLRVPTLMVNFLLLSDLLFAWGRCTRSRYKSVEIRVVWGCVFNFMMCPKVIYTGLMKTEIGNWNSDGYFHRACAICENSWWKVPEKSGWASDNKEWWENLIASFFVFFAPNNQDNAFSLLHGPRQTIPILGATNS